MSLKQFNKKIKLFWLIPVFLNMVLIYQIFYLDRLYNGPSNKITVVEGAISISEEGNNINNNSKNFYIAASKSGKNYYYPNCSGLSRIKPENLVFFASEEAAEAKGLVLAKNCKKP